MRERSREADVGGASIPDGREGRTSVTAIYDALAAWQNSGERRLRCPHKCDRSLLPVIVSDSVQLWCLKCGYTSEKISESLALRLARSSHTAPDAETTNREAS
jgi:hypothetical protein